MACDVAIELRHANGEALQRDGVVYGKTIALNIAACIKARNDLTVLVVHMTILVGLKATDACQHDGGLERTGVIRRIFQRPQTTRIFAEIGVDA